jgi:hypothetical protein
MFQTLTEDLLDLVASEKGDSAPAFADDYIGCCCCCSSSCGGRQVVL